MKEWLLNLWRGPMAVSEQHIDTTVMLADNVVSLWKVVDTTSKNIQSLLDVYKANQKDLDQTFEKIMQCITMHNKYITTLAEALEALAERVKVLENKPAIRKTPLN